MSEKITDKVKSIKDVIAISKPSKEELALIDYKGENERMIAAKHYLLAALIADVLNEGKEPESGCGYIPYFDKARGFAFRISFFDYWNTFALVGLGSRLSFVEEKMADYAGTTFPEIYKPLLIKIMSNKKIK